MEFVPEPLRGRFVVHLRFAFAGEQAEGDRLLAPMRSVATPIMDTVGPMSYADADLVHMDPHDPSPFEMGGALLRDFDDAVQDALLEVAGPGVQTPLLMIEVRAMGGALSRAPRGRDAVSARDAAFAVGAWGCSCRRSRTRCRPRSPACSTRCAPGRPATRW